MKVSRFEQVLTRFKVGSTAMRFAGSTATLVLVVGLAGMWVELSRLRSQLAEVQYGQTAQVQREDSLNQAIAAQKRTSEQLDEQFRNERGERGRLQNEVAKLREPYTEVSSESLGFGVNERPRGGFPEGSRKRIVVPAKTEIVRLRLDLLKDEYPAYVVVLESGGGQEVWRAVVSASRIPKRPSLVVRIPSRLLKGGKYNLVLNGSTDVKMFETISEYPLLVVTK